jgi:hypothetical protein
MQQNEQDNELHIDEVLVDFGGCDAKVAGV